VNPASKLAPAVAPGAKARGAGAAVKRGAGADPARAATASDGNPAARATVGVAVLGASGYSGQEFTRLALGHPGLRLAAFGSREFAGGPASAMLPGLDPRVAPEAPVVDPAELESLLEDGAFEVLVACLPHGAWKELAAAHPKLASAPRWIVDVSSDHRDGSASDSGPAYRYGLPEAFRASLAGATRVANPGCYPTAAALALLPAAEDGWLGGPVVVSALSGVSGAGRKAALRTSFAELDGGAAVYRAGVEHPHVAEMERTLDRVAAASRVGAEHGATPVAFVPQLVPMSRGILLTASAALAVRVSPEEAAARYAARYAGEPFVRMLPAGEWPETRAVRGSNRCDVAVTTLHGGRTLLVTSALDNLVKGAAGQALQNLNLMLGWPEVTGLTPHGSPW
jgi:N-acetyl-gamma-glutamyl-phosphate reductase